MNFSPLGKITFKTKGSLMGFIIVIAILAVDQCTKFFVTRNLHLNQSLPLIKGILHLTLVYNRGAAFGILKNQTSLFIVTSLIAIFLIFLSLRKNNKFSQESLSLCLIVAGAIGNLIDRLFFGYVIDFLDLRIWPVFNIADSAISIGAVLLGLSLIRGIRERPRRTN
jgi:signal peptidase II